MTIEHFTGALAAIIIVALAGWGTIAVIWRRPLRPHLPDASLTRRLREATDRATHQQGRITELAAALAHHKDQVTALEGRAAQHALTCQDRALTASVFDGEHASALHSLTTETETAGVSVSVEIHGDPCGKTREQVAEAAALAAVAAAAAASAHPAVHNRNYWAAHDTVVLTCGHGEAPAPSEDNAGARPILAG